MSIRTTSQETVEKFDHIARHLSKVEAVRFELTSSIKRPELQSGEPTNCSTLPLSIPYGDRTRNLHRERVAA